MIPYNPSSFDRNKTILEQILELKRWLQAHPSYKIYYIYQDYDPDNPQYTWAFSDITSDPTGIEQGDVILFKNSYYAMVYSVDVDNEEIGITPAESFKGPQGPQGATGPQGPQGPAGQYTIININVIPSYLTQQQMEDFRDNKALIVYTDSSSNKYVFQKTKEDNTSLEGTILIPPVLQKCEVKFIRVYKTSPYSVSIDDRSNGFINKENISSYGASNGQVLTADGSNGTSWQTPSTPSVEGTAVLSTGETSGKVLTSNGSNGASWQTPSGTINYVILSSTSGTLTTDELNILLNKDAVIIYNQHYYNKFFESATTLTFAYVYTAGGSSYEDYFNITISTRGYTFTSKYMQNTTNNIDSTGATNGQVLTADGSGGASWQTPSGSAPEIISISGISGNLTASDVSKLSSNSAILKRINYYFTKIYEDTNSIICEEIHQDNAPSSLVSIIITISKLSPYSWYSTTKTIYYQTTAGRVNSETATNGQVLMADGNGGASWQNAGGGSTKYEHNIYFTESTHSTICVFSILNTSSTALTKNDVCSFLANNFPSKYKISTGKYSDSSIQYNIYAVRGTSGYDLMVCGYDSSGNTNNLTIDRANITLTDIIITL